jgi:hypothetical protein
LLNLGTFCVLLCPRDKFNNDGQVKILILLEANVAGSAAVEDGKRELVSVLNRFFKLHDCMYSFNDLTAHDSCFSESGTEYKNIYLDAAGFEGTFDILDECSAKTLVNCCSIALQVCSPLWWILRNDLNIRDSFRSSSW